MTTTAFCAVSTSNSKPHFDIATAYQEFASNEINASHSLLISISESKSDIDAQHMPEINL